MGLHTYLTTQFNSKINPLKTHQPTFNGCQNNSNFLQQEKLEYPKQTTSLDIESVSLEPTIIFFFCKNIYVAFHEKNHGWVCDKKPPKIWKYYLDWINILFDIHLDAFRVENLEESTCRFIFISDPNFESFGWKISGSILRP